MNLNRIFLLLSILILFLCVGSVVAVDDNNLTENSYNIELENNFNQNLAVDSNYIENSSLAEPKTIVVDDFGEYHREMDEHTIREAIQKANGGDTIVINGNYYDHCHLVIDKPLTIVSNVHTSLSHCTNPGKADSGHQGIFYVTSKADGTIIEGFNFINNDGILRDNEGYSIFLDGASNVIIRNCSISNNGVGDAIRINNALGILIENVTVSNAVHGIKIENSHSVTINESFIRKLDYGVVLSDSTNLVLKNNNIENNKISGILMSGNCDNSLLATNNITNNGIGINLTSSNQIDILGNYTSESGNYNLELDELTQIKKGSYSISMVDVNGNVAKDLSGVPMIFYINKIGANATPQAEDVYRIVMMKNGTATVKFDSVDFNNANNTITVVLPTSDTQFDSNVSKTFNISDFSVPGNPSNTTIIISDLNTYPNSNQAFAAILVNVDGKPIFNETLTFTINLKTFNVLTDDKGIAKINVSEPKEGIYVVNVSYSYGESDYYGSFAQGNVIIKKQSTKIVSSNLNMVPKISEYYSITLKDASGKVLVNQYVYFKVNGITYKSKTNSKGVAKIKLKFSKNKKTYRISMNYNGNDQYKGVSKTSRIIVKYSSKKVMLSTPSMTIPKNTVKYYAISLNDINGKPISKQKVTVKIGDKKYVKKTNSKGQIKIKVKFSKSKSYKVTVTYDGNKMFKKTSSTGKIKII